MQRNGGKKRKIVRVGTGTTGSRGNRARNATDALKILTIALKVAFNQRALSIASPPRDLKRPERERDNSTPFLSMSEKKEKGEKRIAGEGEGDFRSSCDYDVILRTYRFHARLRSA